MADIEPFRAFRYAHHLTKDLPRLVCPPYDVISKSQQEKLLRSHPDNFVRVELPPGSPAARYGNAARTWRSWQENDVITRDAEPSFYIYESTFCSQLTGENLTRRGFFAALKIVPWGRGVFPHEKTLPTAKADRLKLFKSLAAQTSPIQVVFEDPRGGALGLYAKDAREPWRIKYTDDAGVAHRLAPLRDPKRIAALKSALKKSPVVIADGHHRYETSRAFRDWAVGRWGAASRASFHVMTYFSSSADKALEILPTHRAVDWEKRRFVQLEKWGRATPVAGLSALKPFMKKSAGHSDHSFGLYRKGRFYRYDLETLPRILRGAESRILAVAALHAGPLHGLGKEDFFFTRVPEEAVRHARARGGWALFLAPNTVADVLRISKAGEVMPPKSTYFYPKLPSGILSYALKGAL